MSSHKSDHKKKPKEKTIHKSKSQTAHWEEKFIQAHLDDNPKLKKIYQDIITKLGGKIPKL